MDANRFRRVGELFDAVVELPSSLRRERLRYLCDDASLLAEVEALLRADERGESFEDAALLQRDALADDDPGDPDVAAGMPVCGPWHAIREIGRGGMGVVYLAEREEGDFRQRGALKLIKRGMDSEPIVARFLRERRVLAQLDHPGIARLLDGGMSADGRPYLVMDHVDGICVAEHVRVHASSLRERLQLFLGVCAAVAYAHRRLVVHRDIKPANVLVTSDGKVKLLDFGIAKLIAGHADLGERTATQAGPYTPHYAAPEQRSGGSIGTMTDVYALGGLLYELLAGSRAPAHGIDIERRDGVAAGSEFVAPSVQVSRIPSGMTGDIRARMLRGDLDTIVLRALHREPERRYASVDALADDVQRHLDGRPIAARRDSRVYRMRSFAVRHRYALGAVTLVVMVSVAAAAFSLRQAAAAREQALRAQTARDFLVGVFAQASPDENAGKPFTAHQLLERGEREAMKLDGTPALQADILTMMGGLYWDIGDYARAKAVTAQAIASGTGASPALRSRSFIVMARVEMELGAFDDAQAYARAALCTAAMAGDAGRAEAVDARRTLVAVLVGAQEYQRADPLLRQLLADDRATFGDSSSEVADDLVLLGKTMENSARGPEGIAAISHAVAILRDLPARSESRMLDALSRLGIAQLHAQDLKAAEPVLRECVAIATRLYGADNIQTWTTRSNLIRVAELAGRFEEAAHDRSELLAVENAALRDSNPAQLASHNKFLAADYRELGRFVQAEAAFRASLAQSIRASGSATGNDISDTLLHLGYTLQLQGRYDEAESSMRDAYAIVSAHELATSQWLNDTRARLGNLLRVRGRHAEALAELRASAAVLTSATPRAEGSRNPILANVLAYLSLAELEGGDARKAETLANDALVLARKSFSRGNFRLGASLFALGRAKLALAQPVAALALFEEALAVRSPPHPEGDPRVLEVQVERVNALAASGQAEQAGRLRRTLGPLLATLSEPCRQSLLRRLGVTR